MTVGEALDDLDRRIAAVHAALDAGEVPDLPDFTPGGDPWRRRRRRNAPGSSTRWHGFVRARQRLREHRARMLEEYAGLDVRRRAATAYAGEA